MQGAIDYGSRRINYTAKFSERGTLAISVLPDCSVEMTAPFGTEQGELERRLRRRAGWVCRQLDRFERFSPRTPPRRYVGGETHLYLGKQYRLKIVVTEEAEHVRLVGGYFIVGLPDRYDTARVKTLLDRWYRDKAEWRLRECFEKALPTFERLGCSRPRLRIQHMPRRWGSRSANGTITLNPDLIRAPTMCIDYVVAHELCHLVEPNHGAAFFRLLGKLMSDWEKRKERLERLLI